MPVAACPLCGGPLRVPEHLAGRQMVCPGCQEIVPGPARQDSDAEVRAAILPAPAPDPHHPEVPLPPTARLGVAALALGLISIMILCLPVLGYAALGLSGVGLLLGLGGLYRAAVRVDAGAYAHAAGAARTSAHFGERRWDFPLAGVAACLLALLPWVAR